MNSSKKDCKLKKEGTIFGIKKVLGKGNTEKMKRSVF